MIQSSYEIEVEVRKQTEPKIQKEITTRILNQADNAMGRIRADVLNDRAPSVPDTRDAAVALRVAASHLEERWPKSKVAVALGVSETPHEPTRCGND